MLRLTLRNLGAHKVRLLLSGLAIVIGVAFVAGTYVFTDTLNKTFKDLFSSTVSDVEISPAVSADSNGLSIPTIPASVLATVRAVPGVARAEGSVVTQNVVLIGPDGKAVTTGGAPTLAATWSDDHALSPYRIVSGRGPTSAGEIAVDSQTAAKHDIKIGDTIHLLTVGPRETAKVTGIFRFGQSGGLAGATLVALDLKTAQQVLIGGKDAFTGISVKSAPGVSQAVLAQRVRTAIDDSSIKVQTGKQAAAEQATDIQNGLRFVNIFLLVFAGVALFVGTFIILITFSMLVAQRTRELALLRALGASRRQITRSVVFEAFAVGLVGATIGLLGGILLALGLKGLFRLFGVDFETGTLVILPRTVIVAYLVGVVVTVAVAWFPARRAAKIPPVAAMRDDVTLPTRSLHVRFVVGAILAGLGVVALASGLVGVGSAGQTASLVGLGAFLVFVGVAVLSPAICRPVVAVIGWPVRRLFGATGTLAVQNAQRDRRRTASTASALMIGMALVAAFGTLGASTTASTDASIDQFIGADVIVYSQTFTPFSAEVAQRVQQVPGVKAVSPLRFVNGKVDGSSQQIVGVDPATAAQAFNLDLQGGSLKDLPSGLALDKQTAQDKGYKLGQTFTVKIPTGTAQLPLVTLYKGVKGAFSGWVTSNAELERLGALPQDSQLYVIAYDSANGAKVADDIGKALASDYPNLKVQDRSAYKQSIRDQVNKLLALIYALLALAVIIAILGIINTLALSVVERTREIGLLRAVGTTRKQMRRMIRLESVVIAIYGALLGIVLGVAYGAALQHAVRSQGISELSIPYGLLAVFVVLSGFVGVLAAVVPARRAAKLDVLKAIATE
ncbi:MAG TPA: FtsX-like permease family protein [Actinomycetes bacterium]|nr:FtsX-like permease family protein [Actinomycetes bacterium]